MNLVDTNDHCDIEKLIHFCKDSAYDDMPASENLNVENWGNKSHTLLYNLFISRRFARENRAGYIIAEQDDRYIAGSGFYPSDNDANICIAGSRTYTVIKKRGGLIHGNFILPKQIELAEAYSYKTIILTFNEYNMWLKKAIEQLGKKEGSIIGGKVPEIYLGWTSLEYPVNIKETKQWCLYRHLDQTYDNTFKQIMADIRTD